MTDVRNPQQFFHGTRHRFNEGDVVEPAAKFAEGGRTGAYASADLVHSSRFAYGEHGRVYRVEPVDPDEVVSRGLDRHGAGYADEQVSRKGFRVLSEVPPPEGGWQERFMETERERNQRVRQHGKTLT